VSVSLLAQLSDPHIRVATDDDGASARALAAAVDAVLALRPAPHAVIVTGDIAEHAEAREYERVRELLAPLPMAVHVLPGNHDDRDALREHFALDDTGGPGEPVQYTARCRDLRVVLCDSTIPGRDNGCVRIDWLEEQLAAEPATPTIVAMHHLPMLTGITVLDGIGVPAADAHALAALFERSPQVRRVVTGHVHRTVVGSAGGCVILACASTHLQSRLEIGLKEFQFVREPPVIALHTLLDGELVSHLQPISPG
jgi:3',5'-cyclic AMP phosphodiesterase CpdA